MTDEEKRAFFRARLRFAGMNAVSTENLLKGCQTDLASRWLEGTVRACEKDPSVLRAIEAAWKHDTRRKKHD